MLSNSLIVLIIVLIIGSLSFSWYLSGKTSQSTTTNVESNAQLESIDNVEYDIDAYVDVSDYNIEQDDENNQQPQGTGSIGGGNVVNQQIPANEKPEVNANDLNKASNRVANEAVNNPANVASIKAANKATSKEVISSIRPSVKEDAVDSEPIFKSIKHKPQMNNFADENDIFGKFNESFPTLIIHEVQVQVQEPESKPLFDTNKVTEVSDKDDYNDVSEESNAEGYEVEEYFGGPFKPLPIPENIKPVRETFSGTIIESEDSAEEERKNASSEQAEHEDEQLPDSNRSDRSDRSIESESSEQQTEERTHEQSHEQPLEQSLEQHSESESSERQIKQSPEEQPLEQRTEEQSLEQHAEEQPLEQRTESESTEQQTEERAPEDLPPSQPPEEQPLEQQTEDLPPSQPPEQEHVSVRFESSSSSSTYSENGEMSNFDIVDIIDSTI